MKNLKSLFPVNRYAQMEVIGLVVIVLLLTIGILFMAQFALRDKPQTTIFLRKELAASALSTLLKTTVNPLFCQDLARPQLSEVLIDCARHFPANFGGSTFQCNNQHSCDFFTETAQFLLGQSLGQWHRNYELQVQLIRTPSSDSEPLLSRAVRGKEGCPNTAERDSSGSFPLPTTDAGLIEATLFVCG